MLSSNNTSGRILRGLNYEFTLNTEITSYERIKGNQGCDITILVETIKPGKQVKGYIILGKQLAS